MDHHVAAEWCSNEPDWKSYHGSTCNELTTVDALTSDLFLANVPNMSKPFTGFCVCQEEDSSTQLTGKRAETLGAWLTVEV